MKKRWKVIDGKRCLLKAGSSPFMQQPFNEMIASLAADRLEIPHVPYTLLWDGGVPYSVCEDFITLDTELVSAVEKTQIAFFRSSGPMARWGVYIVRLRCL